MAYASMTDRSGSDVDLGRAELWGGGGGAKKLKIPPGVGLGRGVQFLIYSLEGGGRATWKPICMATPFTEWSTGVGASRRWFEGQFS